MGQDQGFSFFFFLDPRTSVYSEGGATNRWLATNGLRRRRIESGFRSLAPMPNTIKQAETEKILSARPSLGTLGALHEF